MRTGFNVRRREAVGTTVGTILLAVQAAIVVRGVEGVWLIAMLVPLGLLVVRSAALNVGVVLTAYAPERWPRLVVLPAPTWLLERDAVNEAAERLRALGFEEVGTFSEDGPVSRLPLRTFHSADRRAFARIWTFMGRPQTTFTTFAKDGRVVYTGVVARKALRMGDAGAEQGVTGDVEGRLRAHEELCRKVGVEGDDTPRTKEELLEACMQADRAHTIAMYREAEQPI